MDYDRLQKPKILVFLSLIALITLLTLHLLLKSAQEEKSNEEFFIISSGSVGGNYYKSGKHIEKFLNNIDPKKYKFKSIPSEGSIENIERLKNRFTDFAIVQRDILLKNYFGTADNLKNVTLLTPLFQEKFIIYANTEEDITFDKFKLNIRTKQVKTKIGVTKVDGATHKTFISIANLLGLPLNRIDFVEGNYTQLIDIFCKNKIDYLMTFSLPLEFFKDKETKILYFSKKETQLLTQRMHYFSEASLDDNPSRATIGVWAVLIGLNRSIKKVGDKEIIYQLTKNHAYNNSTSAYINKAINQFKENPGSFSSYFSSLPVSRRLIESIRLGESNLKYIYFTLAILFFILSVYLYARFIIHNRRRWNFIWLRYNHIIIGIGLIAVSYILSIEYLIYLENIFYNSTSSKSRILDLTRSDLHVWNIVRIFAQNDGGVFPLSTYGKMVTTLSSYVIFFGAAGIITIEYLTRAFTAKRRKGLTQVKNMNHVIISGWNSNTPRLIQELLSAAKDYHKKTFKIICVTQNPELILNSDTEVSTKEHERKITLVKGDLRNRRVAEQANAHNALAIILLAEDNTTNSDEKTLMRALSLTKYNCIKRAESIQTVNDKAVTTNQSYSLFRTNDAINTTYMIAEVNNEEFVEDLKNAGVNGIVDRGKIIEGVLVQSLLNPGVSTLLNNVLSFSGDTNEFYTIDLREKSNLRLTEKTFDELLLPLRKNNILLIAIKVVYSDESGEEIVDTDEIEKKLSDDGLTRQIITNPINKKETERKTDNDDQLIVLATNIDNLNKGISNTSFDLSK